MKWEDIGDMLNRSGWQNIKTGQILVFNYEGSRNEYRVMRVDRKHRKCWVRQTTTYHPSEVEIVDAEGKN